MLPRWLSWLDCGAQINDDDPGCYDTIDRSSILLVDILLKTMGL